MPRTLDHAAKAALGANLRDVRNKRGWTQGEAAEKAGILRGRLNKWEKGRETPGTEGLLRLAITYGCPVDDLLGGVDEDYDAIIERRIPVDVQRHYQAKADTFMARMNAAMQLALTPGTPSPSAAAPADASRTNAGRSDTTRTRRGRVEKKKLPKKK